MTPEEVKAGRVFPPNGGRPELTEIQKVAVAEYWRVKGDLKLEQEAVLKLAELGVVNLNRV